MMKMRLARGLPGARRVRLYTPAKSDGVCRSAAFRYQLLRIGFDESLVFIRTRAKAADDHLVHADVGEAFDFIGTDLLTDTGGDGIEQLAGVAPGRFGKRLMLAMCDLALSGVTFTPHQPSPTSATRRSAGSLSPPKMIGG